MSQYLQLPSDGRGEMRVDGRGQAVMEILRLRDHATAEVDSLHHTARRHDP